MRFWSATFGTLAVLLIFALGREWFSIRTGLIAAFLLATSFWHLDFSRMAFRAMLVPTLLLGAFYGLARSWNPAARRPWLWAASGGLCFGLGFHSYIAFRVVPVIAIAVLAFEYFRARRLPLRECAIWLGVTAVVALPMGIYFLNHPEEFTKRADQVSVFSTKSPWQMMADNTIRTAGMFHYEGDCNLRHNMVTEEYCATEVNRPAGLWLLIGAGCAIMALWAGRKSPNFTAAGALLVWVPVMLLPGILANEGAPHALRTIGVLPAVLLLAAWGADRLMTRFPQTAAQAAIVGVTVLAGGLEVRNYFFEWANSPYMSEAFSYRAARVANYSNSLPASVPRYVYANDASSKVPLYPSDPARRLTINMQPIVFYTKGHIQPVYLTAQEFMTEPFTAGAEILLPYMDQHIFDILRDRGITTTAESDGEVTLIKVR